MKIFSSMKQCLKLSKSVLKLPGFPKCSDSRTRLPLSNSLLLYFKCSIRQINHAWLVLITTSFSSQTFSFTIMNMTSRAVMSSRVLVPDHGHISFCTRSALSVLGYPTCTMSGNGIIISCQFDIVSSTFYSFPGP